MSDDARGRVLRLCSEVLGLLGSDPVAAANRLDALADEYRALAQRLRGSVGYQSRGGTGDRVRMQVVGPDGAIRQTIDTGGG